MIFGRLIGVFGGLVPMPTPCLRLFNACSFFILQQKIWWRWRGATANPPPVNPLWPLCSQKPPCHCVRVFCHGFCLSSISDELQSPSLSRRLSIVLLSVVLTLVACDRSWRNVGKIMWAYSVLAFSKPMHDQICPRKLWVAVEGTRHRTTMFDDYV